MDGADGTDAGAGGAGEGMGGLSEGGGNASYGGAENLTDTAAMMGIDTSVLGDMFSEAFDGSFSFDGMPLSNIYGIDFTDMSPGLASAFGSVNEGNPFSEIFAGKYGKGLMALLSLADKTGVVGQMGKMGSLAANPDQGKGWGSLAGSMLGSMVAGPLGGLAGGQLGGMMGQGAFSGLNNAGTGSASASAEGNGGVGGGMLEGLGGMYAAYQGQKGAGDMLGSLQSLYSQNSPYAQAMRQSLQRRDAAGGRRSQYGPREVELQAKLAQMASSQIPAMSQLQSRQNMNRAIMMQQGLGAFNKMGGLQGLQGLFGMGGAGGMFDQAASGLIDSGSLGNLFSLDPLQNSIDTSWIPEFDPWPGG